MHIQHIVHILCIFSTEIKDQIRELSYHSESLIVLILFKKFIAIILGMSSTPHVRRHLKPDNKGISDDDSDEEELNLRQYKVILLGDGTVGKTSIASRFCQDQFGASYKQTIGCDFFTKRIKISRE